jgi:hypothetical protein
VFWALRHVGLCALISPFLFSSLSYATVHGYGSYGPWTLKISLFTFFLTTPPQILLNISPPQPHVDKFPNLTYVSHALPIEKKGWSQDLISSTFIIRIGESFMNVTYLHFVHCASDLNDYFILSSGSYSIPTLCQTCKV